MARHIGPRGKQARRLGNALVGVPKTQKTLNRRHNRPGEHGAVRQGKVTEFGKLLLEKQKMRMGYCLLERQFRRLFKKALRMKGSTGENLFRLLETRLDTVVFRMRLAPSILAARQLVAHGHVRVNGHKCDLPSAQLRAGDEIAVREKSKELTLIHDTMEGRHPNAVSMKVDYLEFDMKTMKGSLTRVPDRSDIPVDINEQLVVEFYSR